MMRMLIVLVAAIATSACHYHVSDHRVVACDGQETSLHFEPTPTESCADVTAFRSYLGL